MVEKVPEQSPEPLIDGQRAEEVSQIRSETSTKIAGLKEEFELSQAIKESIKGWLGNGAEWLREKMSGQKGEVASVLVVILDKVLERVKPDREDEFGGKQSRENIVELVGGETELAKLAKERLILHKLNSAQEFEAAIASGQNLEFDLRAGGFIQHNKMETTL